MTSISLILWGSFYTILDEQKKIQPLCFLKWSNLPCRSPCWVAGKIPRREKREVMGTTNVPIFCILFFSHLNSPWGWGSNLASHTLLCCLCFSTEVTWVSGNGGGGGCDLWLRRGASAWELPWDSGHCHLHWPASSGPRHLWAAVLEFCLVTCGLFSWFSETPRSS